MSIQTIALNKLSLSEKNVRKNSSAGINELAQSILKDGLLQNLSAEKVGKKIEVVAGGRRLAALQLLAKQKKIKADHKVLCLIVEASEAEAVSLAENQLREPMHPVDQLFAFTKRIESGDDISEVANRFGVTEAFVKQRLKLATVSPVLLDACREGSMNVQTLQAFSITDDHKKQEEVWNEYKKTNHWDAEDIKYELVDDAVDTNDPRLKFVGKKAYQKAGGVIINADLFSSDNTETLSDEKLLNELAEIKLNKTAEKLKKEEGFSFVICSTQPFHLFSNPNLCLATTTQAKPSKEVAKQLKALDDKIKKLTIEQETAYDEENYTKGDDLEQQIDEFREQFCEIEETLEVPHPDEVEHLGAVVSISSDGKLKITRNIIDKKNRAKASKQKSQESGDNESQEQPEENNYSAKLERILAANKEAVLKNAVFQQADIALAILVFHMLLEEYLNDHGPLNMHHQIMKPLDEIDEHISSNTAFENLLYNEQQLLKPYEELITAGDDEQLFNAIVTLKNEQLMQLLALCVAKRIDLTTNLAGYETSAPVANLLLSDAIIASHWKPTADNFFNHLSKPAIINAVKEALPNEAHEELASMKKGEAASAAEALLKAVDHAWLPLPMRMKQEN